MEDLEEVGTVYTHVTSYDLSFAVWCVNGDVTRRMSDSTALT